MTMIEANPFVTPADTGVTDAAAEGMRHFQTASIAAVLNILGQGVIGTGFWLLAARLYSDTDVSVAIAATSVVLVVSSLGQLNLHASLSRFLPAAGASQRAYVAYTYRLTVAISVVLGVGVLAVGQLRGGELVHGGNWALTWVLALSLPVWTIFALQDSVLVSVRRALWVPIENVLVVIAKLAVLPLLVFAGGGAGVLAAWVLPSGIAVLYVSFCLRRDILHPGTEPMPDRRSFVQFSMLDFPGAFAYVFSLRVVPVLIVEHNGAAGAYPALAFTIVATAGFVLPAISLGLLAELSHADAAADALLRRAIRIVIFAAFPACILGALLARPVLSLAGSAYGAGGAQVLAFGVLGLAAGALAEIGLTALRSQDRVKASSAVQIFRGIILVAGTVALFPSNSTRLVGVVFAVANGAAAAVALGLARPRRPEPVGRHLKEA